MIRSATGVVIADVLLAILGAGLLMAFGTWARTTPLARIGLSLFAGLAAFSAAVPPLLYVGLSPTPIVVSILAAVAVVVGVVLDRRRERPPPDPGGGGPLVAAVATVPVVLLSAVAVVQPTWIGDTILDWTLKAKVLYGHGGALTGALDERFFGGDTFARAYAHLEYPLALPSLEAYVFHFMGSADTRVIHLQFVALLAAFAASLWALLRPYVDRLLLGAAVVALLMSPALQVRLLSAYADIPLAIFWTAAALALGIWVRQGSRDRLLLGSLFAAAALGTKQEGTLFCIILFIGVATALAVNRERRRLGRLAVAGTVAAATAIPWQLYVRSHDLENPGFEASPGRVASQLDTLPQIVFALGRPALDSDWLYVLPLSVAGGLILLRRGCERGLAAAYLLTLVALFASLGVVYLTADPDRSILAGSASRVVSTPMLLSAALLPILLERALARNGVLRHLSRVTCPPRAKTLAPRLRSRALPRDASARER
jgi:hypothetical protein